MYPRSRKVDFIFEIFPCQNNKAILVKSGQVQHEVLEVDVDLGITSLLMSCDLVFHHLPMTKTTHPSSFLVCLYNPKTKKNINRVYCYTEQLELFDLSSTSYVSRYYISDDNIVTYHSGAVPKLSLYNIKTSSDAIWSATIPAKTLWACSMDSKRNVLLATEHGLYKLNGKNGDLVWSLEVNLAPSNHISLASLNVINEKAYLTFYKSSQGALKLCTSIIDVDSGEYVSLPSFDLDYTHWLPIPFFLSPLNYGNTLLLPAPSPIGVKVLQLDINTGIWTEVGLSTVRTPRRLYVLQNGCIVVVGMPDCPRIEIITPNDGKAQTIFSSRQVSNFDCVPISNDYLGLFTQQHGLSKIEIIEFETGVPSLSLGTGHAGDGFRDSIR